MQPPPSSFVSPAVIWNLWLWEQWLCATLIPLILLGGWLDVLKTWHTLESDAFCSSHMVWMNSFQEQKHCKQGLGSDDVKKWSWTGVGVDYSLDFCNRKCFFQKLFEHVWVWQLLIKAYRTDYKNNKWLTKFAVARWLHLPQNNIILTYNCASMSVFISCQRFSIRFWFGLQTLRQFQRSWTIINLLNFPLGSLKYFSILNIFTSGF